MPLQSLRPILARFRNIFVAMLLGIVLVVVVLMVSLKEPVAAPGEPDSEATTNSQDPQSADADPDAAGAPRIAFSTEELLGTADPATANSLAFDLQPGGPPALLVWSSSGVQIYSNGFTPVAAPALAGFKNVRDVSAADFDNDGFVDLCVIDGHGATLLSNRNGSFEPLGSGFHFKGRYAQALWLDEDHDGNLDLILLGARSLVLRNRGVAGFAPRPKAIPFVAGTALAGVVVRRLSDAKAVDFVVSDRDRAGVFYRDNLDGTYRAQRFPELPAGAHHLRADDFTGDGVQDLAFLAGGNAVLLENLGSSWRIRKTVPANGGFLFTDFSNLAVRDWLAGGVLLAGDDANFSQSREMATASATSALVAADFNLDGKLDFAGVTRDGAILRCLNQTDTLNRWLRITPRNRDAAKTIRGTVVKVKSGARSQQFLYEASSLHVGVRSNLTVDTIQLTWPDGTVQTETNLETNRAYVFEEAQPLSSSGGTPSPPPGASTASPER